jgi:hypothetical protein
VNTPAERVWERINETAGKLAAEKSMPSPRHAQAIIAQILRAEAVGLPPQHTIESLADELIRLITISDIR